MKHHISKLPTDIIYEIILFIQDPYTDDRKKLMYSIRREYKRKLMIKAKIPYSHAWRILDTDSTINDLFNEPPAIHNNSQDGKFNLPISIWLKIHRYIKSSQHFPIGHHFYTQSDNSSVLDYSIWRWRRIAEINWQ